MKRKILALFLAAVILSVLASCYVFADSSDAVASGTCGYNIIWTFDEDGTLTISGSGYMTNYSYYSNAPWYNYSSKIKAVIISNGVKSIGNYAFLDCSSLESVTIPDSVTSIGDYAFYYCSSLGSVTIPDSVTSIGNYAFSGCSSLESVYISDLSAWCKIKFGSFDANPCYNDAALYLNGELLTDIQIPDSVKSIGDYAFDGCSGLKSVTIPDSVTSIGNDAFRDLQQP